MRILLIKAMICFLFFFCSYHPPPVNAADIVVTVTAYSSESSKTKGITASGCKERMGIIALSRDLEKELNIPFGVNIMIEGIGVFEYRDRMNAKWKRRVDVWLPTTQEAKAFGKRKAKLSVTHAILAKEE